MGDLRYRVAGPMAVAGAPVGETLRVDADDVDEHGRHLATGERVNLAAAVAGGALVPLSKAAGAAAGVVPDASEPVDG